MPARPGQWSLLTGDGADPVPGNPEAVAGEAHYYATMAQTILAEAHRLHTLGESSELVGKYSTSLKSELNSLADEVHKAHRRYDQVGGALKPYAAALHTARDESAAALRDAENAHADQQRADAMPDPTAAPGKKLSNDQQTDKSSRANAVTEANKAMGAARTRLANALDALNTAGSRAAGSINDGSDDKLKDHHHWWDVVVKIVKILVEVANYIAIAAAIVMIFIPGLDLLDLALMATYAAFAGDLFLYSTGNASALDLAFDVVGIATLGMGGGLEAAGKEITEEASTFAVKYAGRRGAEYGTRVAGARTMQEGAQSYARGLTDYARSTPNEMVRLTTGSKGLAEADRMTEVTSTAFSRSTKLAAMRDEASSLTRMGQVSYATSSTTLLGNAIASPSNLPYLDRVKPYSSTWNSMKERTSLHSPLHVESWDW